MFTLKLLVLYKNCVFITKHRNPAYLLIILPANKLTNHSSVLQNLRYCSPYNTFNFVLTISHHSSSGMILIDLQKAFDTIDHKILIEKMKCMGFSNDVIKWFESYLSKRMFSVHVEKGFSDKALISCGVTQGSILGPLLFFIYVNDMVQAVNCDLLLYVDDTGFIFQHKDINIIEQQLN